MDDAGYPAGDLLGEIVRLRARLSRLSADALLPRVWRPERVSEGALLRDAVKKLCRKMGDDAAALGCIITGARAEYRMTAR